MFPIFKSIKYARLPTSSNEAKLPEINQDKYHISTWLSYFDMWKFGTFLFACLFTWSMIEKFRLNEHGTFESGFRTDFAPARQFIEIEEVIFTGSPRFDEKDGSEYIPARLTNEPEYVGEPSASIDTAWAELTWGRYILLTDAEAESAWGSSYEQFWDEDLGGYAAGLDMLHTLHCLEHIRKSFYPKAYPIDSPIHGVLHRDHCIDHLRQMIMCYADITPIPTRYYPGIRQNYIDSDRPHTCRSFSKLRDWITERYNGTLAVPPRHKKDNSSGQVQDSRLP